MPDEPKPNAQLTATENTAPPPPMPGQTITDCPSCPEMMVIPAGAFEMGSPAKEIGRFADEGPTREVSVASIAIGKYEVTFAQWDACLAGGGCKEFSPSDNAWGRGRRPVTGISRADAQAYIDWLNLQVGRPVYRLPTEAEWEYAARAGTKTAYSFGDKISRAEANFGTGRSDPVGSYAANAFGLYDMHGNVFEWTADCYADSYKGAALDGGAPASPACKMFVYRGGSYADKAGVLRAANRRKGPGDLRNATIGLRVARNLN